MAHFTKAGEAGFPTSPYDAHPEGSNIFKNPEHKLEGERCQYVCARKHAKK